jgi:carboxyl-terminal processing protease
MLGPETAYIKLNRFSMTTMKEYREAVKELRSKGMENLVLDLRNNTGGYMHIAIQLADEFLDNQKLVVYTKGEASPKQDYFASSRGGFEDGKLILIINEGSASASEILAGAVQDWDRGLVIGRRSYGKALVQKPYPLPDGSVIRLTTARYYTPSGRSIQKPYDDGVDEYFKDFSKRIKRGELVNADSINFPDSLKFFTKNKRVVFGGGGIMPDVFIPWDSNLVSDYYAKLLNRGIINDFIIDYLGKIRDDLLNDYPNIDTFINDYIINENFINSITEYADKKGIKNNDSTTDNVENQFQNTQIKALIARNLYNLEAYYMIMNEIDEECLKAMEIIHNDALFTKLSAN